MQYSRPTFAFPSATAPYYPDRYQSENVTKPKKIGASAGGDQNRCPLQFDRAATDKFCSAAYANYTFPLPAPPQSEVQRLKINATAGQFTITVPGNPTPAGPAGPSAPLNFNASVGEVTAQLGSIGVGQEITASGQPSDYTFTYRSGNREKNVPPIVVDETPGPPRAGSAVPPPLSGAPAGTPQSVVTTVIEGASAKPTYPPVAVLIPSTTAVNGGGITRGLLVTSSPVNARLVDRFSYLDPTCPAISPRSRPGT